MPYLPTKFYLFVHSNAKKLYLIDYPDESMRVRYLRKMVYYINFRWEAFMCNKANKIISVSPSLKVETENQYHINSNKVVVVTNGIDTKIFKKTYPSKTPVKNLLYVGKISYRKNIVDLIRIFKQLINVDQEFKLYILGSGEQEYMRKVHASIAKYKLNDKVYMYPYSTDDALNDLYGKCGIFVLTSLVEGFGLVVLEAMTKGLPVVAYDNLGVRDIIDGTNGYLIRPFDYQNFVNKILYLYNNSKIYRKMSLKAQKTVDTFSWDKSVNKLVKELQC